MKKKAIGWVFLFLALFFFSPIPDPLDVVGLKLYSMYSGVDFGLNNISEIYVDYVIFTSLIALIFLILAMNFLGWSWRRLWNKLDIGKYKIALFFGILVVVLIAILDIQGMILFTKQGFDYTNGEFPEGYWEAFRNTAYILMGLLALTYYFFIRKDKSETLAVFLTPFILFWFGLSDILYFVFQKIPIPEMLPWLDNHLIIGWISNTLGFSQVTNVSLIASVLIGGILVFVVTKVLKEKF